MRAAVCTRYGPPEVVQIEDVAKPKPKDNEVLVRVHATAVSSGDARVRGSNFPGGFKIPGRLMMGIRRPRNPILGSDVAGEVEAVGKDVTGFRKGDTIVGSTWFGAHAEYTCLPQKAAIAHKPAKLSYEVAAALPFGGLTAIVFLRDLGKVAPGQKVLVYGASGSVGTAAVQFARHLGADVTGVCSGANVDFVRSLGAHEVIDYTKEDFTKSGETYDVILDTLGKVPFSKGKRSLKPKGRLLEAVSSLGQLMLMPWTAKRPGKKFIPTVASARTEDLVFLLGLAEAGTMRAVIDRTYPLEKIADAHRYVDGGHKRGNVVIRVVP